MTVLESLAATRATSYRKSQVTSDFCTARGFSDGHQASSVSVFRPGSTSPSAILFDAWENFNNRSPKADENIRSIKLDLAAAVDEVIDAAGQEWEPAWQRMLLSVRIFPLGPFTIGCNFASGRELWQVVPGFV